LGATEIPPHRRGGGRLTRRTAAVSVLLSVVIGGAFFLLAVAIEALRDSKSRANHELEVRAGAMQMERLVIEIESTQRAFIVTGDTRVLAPWYRARADFVRQAASLERLAAAGGAGQGVRAHQITRAVDAYIREYAVPLVAMARHDLGSARTPAVTEEGKHRVDALSASFDQFTARESEIFKVGQDRADAIARQALVVASVSVAGSIALILLCGGYLARSVVRPVRRASVMAGRVAGGDLAVRMPETGPGEVGVLARAFNAMTGSLETSRDDLAASRARVVAAADETRRRIERDLHDGTQQRLISLALDLRAAQARVPPEQQDLVQQWSRTAQGLADAVEELREISRGLHPAVLERGGLGPALRALARRAALPVKLSVRVSGRLQERVEVAAYYVVSEALTNAAKHARASVVQVDIGVADQELRLLVRDDGAGGADPSRGSGLIGLSDRVEAVGGRVEITSPPGGGTSLLATIPVEHPDAAASSNC
jgi:signal transduction histidine kinase